MFTIIGGKRYLADPLNQKALKYLGKPTRLSNEAILVRIWGGLLVASILGIAACVVGELLGIALACILLLLGLVLVAATAVIAQPSTERPFRKRFIRLVEREEILELPISFLEAFDKLLLQSEMKYRSEAAYQATGADFVAVRTALHQFRRGLPEDKKRRENHIVSEVLQTVVDRIKAAGQAEQQEHVETRE